MVDQLKDTSERLIVCLVADESVSERIPSALRYLQIGLIDEAVDVILVVPRDDRSDTLATGPTTLLTYHAHGWPLANWSRRQITELVVQKAQSLKPTAPVLVHGLSTGCALLAADIATALDGQLVMSLWSGGEAGENAVIRIIDHIATILTPSNTVARAVAGRIPVQRPVEIVPLGVPVAAESSAFGADDRSPTIVFAGALREDMGIEAMLRAAKRAMQKFPNLLVFLVGKGPAETALRHVATELGIAAQVVFTGRLEYLRRAIEAADVFCLPSAREPFREELLHAMACGLAIIAVDGNPYDVLEHDRTALLHADSSEDALTEHLLRLLSDHQEARRLGAAARAQAITRNSVAKMVAGHTRIYRALARRDRTFTLSPAGKGV